MSAPDAGVDRQFLRVSEVAALLGVPKQTVYTWVRAGKIPSLKLGAAVLVPISQLRQVLGGD